ncbi:MAG: hypothetical protein K0S58_1038 [Nitrospira sp.]|jgi:hypothetical protein|nr:hypothetical protein [Nitrospira sp.]
MLNIRRLDHDASNTHCWRLSVKRQCRIHRRSFSDGQHGGRAQALQVAQVYRDQLMHSYPPLAMPVYCAILKKNNRSSVSGLLRVEVCRGKCQHKMFWEAQWPTGNGRSRHRKFSILKYGEQGGVSESPNRPRHGLRSSVGPNLLAL